MTSIEDIKRYLVAVKSKIKKREYIFSRKALDELTELGIGNREALLFISNLTYKRYYQGPQEDHKINQQNVWMFGCDVDDYQLYIKFTIKLRGELFLISFHKADYPIKYPYT